MEIQSRHGQPKAVDPLRPAAWGPALAVLYIPRSPRSNNRSDPARGCEPAAETRGTLDQKPKPTADATTSLNKPHF